VFDPQIIVVRDQDGIEHHSGRWSEWVVAGLADGSLTEVHDEAPVPADDHGDDPRPINDGSGDGESSAGDFDGDDDEGDVESASGR
jgi:hypothetical protein